MEAPESRFERNISTKPSAEIWSLAKTLRSKATAAADSMRSVCVDGCCNDNFQPIDPGLARYMTFSDLAGKAEGILERRGDLGKFRNQGRVSRPE